MSDESQNESNELCNTLTTLLEEKFRGHPYRWDYSTKCLFLMLDMVSQRLLRENTVNQDDIILNCGMGFLGPRNGANMLRAVNISSTRTFGLRLSAVGNREEREYWFENRDEVLCLRRFFNRPLNLNKSRYLSQAVSYATIVYLEEEE